MPKRDYRSYGVLDEELSQEENLQNYEELREIDTRLGETKKGYDHTEEAVHNEIEGTDNSVELQKDISEADEPVITYDLVKPEIIKPIDEQELIKRVNLYKKENMKEPVEQHIKDTNVNTKDYSTNEKNKGNEEDRKVEENDKNKAVDMSFSGYKSYQQTRERSRFTKWLVRLMKVILIIMLLPFLSIIGIGIVTFLGGFITAIIGSVGTGFVALGAAFFMSPQLDASLVALGVSAAVTAISFGGILSIIFCMLMKWIISLFRKNKKPRKKLNVREER